MRPSRNMLRKRNTLAVLDDRDHIWRRVSTIRDLLAVMDRL